MSGGVECWGSNLKVNLATATRPLVSRVTIAGIAGATFATATVGCSDGTVSGTMTPSETFDCVYSWPGVFSVGVVVKDANDNVIFQGGRKVVVLAPEDQIATVKAVYSAMVSRLRAGDSSAALNLVVGTSREKYADIFAKIGANLATYAGQLGSIGQTTVSGDYAEILIAREVGGALRVFPVYLILGEDGIWRIESM